MKRTMGVKPIEKVFLKSFDECGEWTLDDILEWLADYNYLNRDRLYFKTQVLEKVY